jgi:hypothetical protein
MWLTCSSRYWESPNNINPGLVWHQPHVIYMSELEYRAAPNASAKEEVLQRLKGIVDSTAQFIADFPERRIGTGTGKRFFVFLPIERTYFKRVSFHGKHSFCSQCNNADSPRTTERQEERIVEKGGALFAGTEGKWLDLGPPLVSASEG